METDTATLDTVLSLSELAARLGVTVQAIYGLRSQGRGPRGFCVGRELRFRVTEIDARLARLEEADAARHPHTARPRAACDRAPRGPARVVASCTAGSS